MRVSSFGVAEGVRSVVEFAGRFIDQLKAALRAETFRIQ
jgi:hypothetical protein